MINVERQKKYSLEKNVFIKKMNEMSKGNSYKIEHKGKSYK